MKKSRLDFKNSKSLIVCPSLEWNSIQRRALKDAVFLHRKKSDVFLYCFKNSILDYKAKEYGIKTLYYQGKSLTRPLDLTYLRELNQIFKKDNFNFVHCFSLKYIWMLSLALYSKKSIPLFLTVNKVNGKIYKGFFFKWLLKRVDRVFTFSQTLIDIIPITLDLPKRKVKFSGFGIESTKEINTPNNYLEIVLVVSNKDIYILENFIAHISKMVNPAKQKIIIYYDDSVVLSDSITKIKNIIISLQVGEFVGLRKYDNSTFSKNKLFINISEHESISDLEVHALMRNTLVLAPRSLARNNLCRIFFNAMTTYQYGNFHDLKKSLGFLLNNYNDLSIKLFSQQNEAEFYHGAMNYFELLIKNYIKINKLRFRYSKTSKN